MSLLTIIKSTLGETIIDIFCFPFWWYSTGLKKRLIGFKRGVVGLARNLALKLMITHLFKPMFGERSKSGRIISFFMRLILLIWRLFLFIVGAAGQVVLLILWMVLPLVAVWQIVNLL